jgi:hypothetical protein
MRFCTSANLAQFPPVKKFYGKKFEEFGLLLWLLMGFVVIESGKFVVMHILRICCIGYRCYMLYTLYKFVKRVKRADPSVDLSE